MTYHPIVDIQRYGCLFRVTQHWLHAFPSDLCSIVSSVILILNTFFCMTICVNWYKLCVYTRIVGLV